MTPRIATFLMFVVNGAVIGTWIANIPGIQSSLRLSGTEMGLILLAAALGALVSQQVTGQLLVRFSSHALLRVSSFAYAPLAVLPLLAPSALMLAPVMFGFGAVNTIMDISMNSHGVALESSGGRSIFSRLHAGWSIGGLVAAVAVAAAVTMGIAATTEAAVAASVVWVVVVVAGRHLGVGSVRTEGAGGIHWPSRAVLPIALLIVLIAFVEGGLSDWGGIYMRRSVGSAAEVAALAYAALSVGLTVGRLGGDAVKDHIGSIRLIQSGMLLCALAIALMLIARSPAMALLGMVVAGMGMANVLPQLLGAAGRIPPAGPSLSAAFSFLTLTFMIGPLVIGATSDAIDLTAALGLLVAASVVVALAVPRVPRAETNPRFVLRDDPARPSHEPPPSP